MVMMLRIHAVSSETEHQKKVGTFVRRNTYKGRVISEPPLNSYPDLNFFWTFENLGFADGQQDAEVDLI